MTYASSLSACKRMISAKGQAVTLTSHSAGAYDTTAGAATLTDTQVVTVGVLLPLSRGLAHIPGTNIQASDQQLLLPGDIAQPSLDTTVTIGSNDYTLVEVKPLNPGGVNILYDCLVRGAQ
jgi:hypothetical protein